MGAEADWASKSGAGARRRTADPHTKGGGHRRGAGRPPGSISEETRARIIEAACRCFAERGYSKTSNQDIARDAGLTAGALYHYFDSKADLFAAVYRDSLRRLVEAYQQAFTVHKTCVEQLCSGIEASHRLNRAAPELLQFTCAAHVEMQRHPQLRNMLHGDSQGIRAFFTLVLAEGQRRGELVPEVDLEAAVDLLIAAFFGLAWLRAEVAGDEEYGKSLWAFEHMIRGTLFRAPQQD